MTGKQSKSIEPRPPGAWEIVLRVRVVAPPKGILFCIQGKSGEFLQQTRSKGEDLLFDTVARVAGVLNGKPPGLLGRSVQGPAHGRFVYICSGTYAGETNTPWARRAKVPLAEITFELVMQGIKKGALQATISGTGRDGGPACGSVPLIRGWIAVS